MPTVEELYRNYGILADATEQVGQVSPRAACRARRPAASGKRSEPGGDCSPPSRGLPASGLFRLDRPLFGSVASGFTRESEVPGPLGRPFSAWRFLAASREFSLAWPPRFLSLAPFGGAQPLGRLQFEFSR